jgi:2-amino-4-hydroxy-6-hydroxymethyldihydropteridine diphosphokinase
MMKNRAYLSLGSNIEPVRNIRAALQLLGQKCKLLAVSTIWETEPLGFKEQAYFLNGAAIIETEFSAPELKARVLQRIEQALGRVRGTNRYAPRPIDLDIILFNDEVLEFEGYNIPSPEVLERWFVAVPLAEIAPDYVHPITGQTLQEIATSFEAEAKQMLKRDEFEPFTYGKDKKDYA